MNERHERWADRLSEFLDGSLAEPEHSGCEEHLAECGSCRRVLEDLRAVIAEAGALSDRGPSRDLWPGIAAAVQAPIEAATPDRQVIALPTAARPSRKSWSTPQFAAAAVVLMTLSASVSWWLSPGTQPSLATEGTVNSALVQVGAELPGPRSGLAGELETLQGQLEVLLPTLDEETLAVLERNLTVIEGAIEDSRRALADDPANEFLSEHLDRAYERKLDYLREAAEIARWVS